MKRYIKNSQTGTIFGSWYRVVDVLKDNFEYETDEISGLGLIFKIPGNMLNEIDQFVQDAGFMLKRCPASISPNGSWYFLDSEDFI